MSQPLDRDSDVLTRSPCHSIYESINKSTTSVVINWLWGELPRGSFSAH